MGFRNSFSFTKKAARENLKKNIFSGEVEQCQNGA
jgi:hypothetical protein